MNVAELFKRLSHGELKDIHMGSETPGTIRTEDQAAVLGHATHALRLLFTRFPIRRDYLTIRLSEDIHRYALRPVHNESDTDVGNTEPRFIVDAENPYTGDLLKIVSLTDAYGRPLTLNKIMPDGFVRTLEFDTLYFSAPEQDKLLMIEYQAAHPALTDPVNLGQDIELPYLLEEALLAKICARVYASMNGEENAAKAGRLELEYEAVCQLAEAHDTVQATTEEEFDLFYERGFV